MSQYKALYCDIVPETLLFLFLSDTEDISPIKLN